MLSLVLTADQLLDVCVNTVCSGGPGPGPGAAPQIHRAPPYFTSGLLLWKTQSSTASIEPTPDPRISPNEIIILQSEAHALQLLSR